MLRPKLAGVYYANKLAATQENREHSSGSGCQQVYGASPDSMGKASMRPEPSESAARVSAGVCPGRSSLRAT